MNARLAQLRRRRELLTLRAQAQRLEIETLVQRWRGPLTYADTLFAAARRVQRFWLVYALMLALLVRSRRVPFGTWIGRMWTAWEIYRALRPTGARASRQRSTVRSER